MEGRTETEVAAQLLRPKTNGCTEQRGNNYPEIGGIRNPYGIYLNLDSTTATRRSSFSVIASQQNADVLIWELLFSRSRGEPT